MNNLTDNNWILSLGTFLPLLGALAIMFGTSKDDERTPKIIGILTAGLTLAVGIATLVLFDYDQAQNLQFFVDAEWIEVISSGYTIGLDMTIRGTEDRSYRKSLDTFTVLGPHVVTADEIANPGKLDFWLTINGEPRQKSNTSMLIFGIAKLIAYASKAYTLYPGDVILTGTPEGVAPVVPGDRIDAWIEEIGPMQVMVRGS